MFAIYKCEPNSNLQIYTTAATEREAWDTLAAWLAEDGTDFDTADWDIVPCSQAVHDSDGLCPWTLGDDGVARLDSEATDAP